MEEYEQEFSSRKSKINSAGFELERINVLWTKCHAYREQGNLAKYNHELDSVWTEIGSGLHPENKKDRQYIKEMFDLNLKIIKYRNNRNMLNQYLMKKHIFLKRLQDLQGKGTAYQDEDEDAIE